MRLSTWLLSPPVARAANGLCKLLCGPKAQRSLGWGRQTCWMQEEICVEKMEKKERKKRGLRGLIDLKRGGVFCHCSSVKVGCKDMSSL